MNGRKIPVMMFSALIIFMFVSSASAEEINIVDVYSDINSADITLHSTKRITNIALDAELLHDGKVLDSKHLTIDEISPDSDVAKVVSWDVKSPEDGIYRAKFTLTKDGSVIGSKYCNFSYGWQAMPRIFIRDIIADSSGISVILTPSTNLYGSIPVLADVDYMLVDGDTVIYKVEDNRVTVAQVTPLSKNWNTCLEGNHQYSVRVKVKIYSPTEMVIAQSKDFTSIEDAQITEIYRDETGASATILGLSQVPFKGDVIFTVTKNGKVIEEIKETAPILMLSDDETVEVIWGSRLTPGVYDLSVKVVGNNGGVVDTWDTIIEAEQSISEETPTPTPEETPGFNIGLAALSLVAVYLVARHVKGR